MRKIECPVSGPINFSVTTTSVDVDITAWPNLRAAQIQVTGPDKALDAINPQWQTGTWHLEIPRDISGTSGITVSGGDVVFGGSSVSFNRHGSGRGGVHIGQVSGRVVVNGVDVTDYVAGQQGHAPGQKSEPLTIRVLLPEGSSVTAQSASGSIVTHGVLNSVSVSAASGDADIDQAAHVSCQAASGDVSVDTLTGPAIINTASGGVGVSDARGAIQAQTASGNIRIHATESVNISARSMSGSVKVTASSGASPRVSATSMTGRVRTPGGR